MTVKAPHRRATWHDAFDAQMALWRWYRTPMGRLYMRNSVDTETRNLDFEETRELLRYMYSAERDRLLDSDPVYVSAEMCQVVEAAAPLFKPEALLETDLMTTRGFIYFEQPFGVPDRFDEPTTIAGCSWNRLFNSRTAETVQRARKMMEEWEGPLMQLEDKMLAEEPDMEPYGISLTLYCDTRDFLEHLGENPHGRQLQELYGLNIPRMVPLHLTPWYFNMSFDGNEWDTQLKPTGAEWWWRVIQTTFRLMQQRISSKQLQKPGRSARREAKKIGARPDTEVVVVRLRREKGEKHEPTGESANYSHRFIVGGHWRNAWYNSVREHRQIWISPYVKGPADKPLIVRPKRVYQWDR